MPSLAKKCCTPPCECCEDSQDRRFIVSLCGIERPNFNDVFERFPITIEGSGGGLFVAAGPWVWFPPPYEDDDQVLEWAVDHGEFFHNPFEVGCWNANGTYCLTFDACRGSGEYYTGGSLSWRAELSIQCSGDSPRVQIRFYNTEPSDLYELIGVTYSMDYAEWDHEGDNEITRDPYIGAVDSVCAGWPETVAIHSVDADDFPCPTCGPCTVSDDFEDDSQPITVHHNYVATDFGNNTSADFIPSGGKLLLAHGPPYSPEAVSPGHLESVGWSQPSPALDGGTICVSAKVYSGDVTQVTPDMIDVRSAYSETFPNLPPPIGDTFWSGIYLKGVARLQLVTNSFPGSENHVIRFRDDADAAYGGYPDWNPKSLALFVSHPVDSGAELKIKVINTDAVPPVFLYRVEYFVDGEMVHADCDVPLNFGPTFEAGMYSYGGKFDDWTVQTNNPADGNCETIDSLCTCQPKSDYSPRVQLRGIAAPVGGEGCGGCNCAPDLDLCFEPLGSDDADCRWIAEIDIPANVIGCTSTATYAVLNTHDGAYVTVTLYDASDVALVQFRRSIFDEGWLSSECDSAGLDIPLFGQLSSDGCDWSGATCTLDMHASCSEDCEPCQGDDDTPPCGFNVAINYDGDDYSFCAWSKSGCNWSSDSQTIAGSSDTIRVVLQFGPPPTRFARVLVYINPAGSDPEFVAGIYNYLSDIDTFVCAGTNTLSLATGNAGQCGNEIDVADFTDLLGPDVTVRGDTCYTCNGQAIPDTMTIAIIEEMDTGCECEAGTSATLTLNCSTRKWEGTLACHTGVGATDPINLTIKVQQTGAACTDIKLTIIWNDACQSEVTIGALEADCHCDGSGIVYRHRGGRFRLTW